MNDYRVLLYYHYVKIEDPQAAREEHLTFCKSINLLGRIYISEEGINGTVSGLTQDVDTYITWMENHHYFKGVTYKIDEADAHAFKKMHVRVKNELVNFSLEDDINPKELTGRYVEPKEFFERISDPDTIIIDARNDYEFDLGHFRGAVKPEIKTFRELPNWIRENKDRFKGKKILTYCTGGVRCEKFSGWLKREGFDDVGQLHGGIVTYGKDPVAQGAYWDGQCYVFDNRIAVPVNRVNPRVVGRDFFTGEPCERYINCANPECNKQFLCTEENEKRFRGSCSDACRIHPRNRYVEK
ncbi:rhodanese-related sulfurtransferase [Acholeplasma vituli]|uniref:tRNA uridine(34) hydroxylase n=1 Tax=Paracholeplasma vituli TaxID=69473 RepID=A0ABT2PW36_9MOLU|nr:rhodanese-related sulfurtransferase [Paracholeplasma vituli]MCU0104928.1 rhodanese-related sulfurtransferase [Paracholeplasma vituli]